MDQCHYCYQPHPPWQVCDGWVKALERGEIKMGEENLDEMKESVKAQTTRAIEHLENLIGELPAGVPQDQAHFRFTECCAWMALAVEQI